MEFGLSVDETDPHVTVVAVSGEIDVSTAPRLRSQLVELIGSGRVNIVVDLEAVGFLDSTALGVLVSTVKRVRNEGGDLVLVCRNEHILKVLEITGLSTVFSIHDTLAHALAG